MDNSQYKTKTLNLAAYLCASGVELLKTSKEQGETFFIFIPRDKAERLLTEYFNGTASVDPRELFARLNDLRDLIFSGGNKR